MDQLEQFADQDFDSHKDRFFRGQGHEEHVLAFCRRHWPGLIFEITGFVIAIIAIIFFVLFYTLIRQALSPALYNFIIFTCAPLLIYYFHRFFLILFRHHLTVIIITNIRILSITKSIYFINEKETVDLLMIQDVHKYQSGFFENMFNFGDLYITLASSAAGIRLKLIPNPEFHLRLINKAKHEAMEHQNTEIATGEKSIDDELNI